MVNALSTESHKRSTQSAMGDYNFETHRPLGPSLTAGATPAAQAGQGAAPPPETDRDRARTKPTDDASRATNLSRRAPFKSAADALLAHTPPKRSKDDQLAEMSPVVCVLALLSGALPGKRRKRPPLALQGGPPPTIPLRARRTSKYRKLYRVAAAAYCSGKKYAVKHEANNDTKNDTKTIQK